MTRSQFFIDAIAVSALAVLIIGGVWFSLKKENEPERLKQLEQMREGEFQFSFMDLKQKERNLTQYYGKVVLVNIWATWCPPCIEELPSLLRLAQKFQKKLTVIAVSEESIEDIQNFFSQWPQPTQNFILSTSLDIQKTFSPQALPESYLLDKQGRLVLKIVGSQDWNNSEWSQKIKELIQQ